MRKTILALAAAGSMFAATSAFAAGTVTTTAGNANINSRATTTVTVHDCTATSAAYSFGYVTDTGTDFGKVNAVTITVAGGTGCTAADLQVGTGTILAARELTEGVATFTITPVSSIASLTSVLYASAPPV